MDFLRQFVNIKIPQNLFQIFLFISVNFLKKFFLFVFFLSLFGLFVTIIYLSKENCPQNLFRSFPPIFSKFLFIFSLNFPPIFLDFSWQLFIFQKKKNHFYFKIPLFLFQIFPTIFSKFQIFRFFGGLISDYFFPQIVSFFCRYKVSEMNSQLKFTKRMPAFVWTKVILRNLINVKRSCGCFMPN